MSAELDKIAFGLMKNGYGPAAHKIAALKFELYEKGLLPESLHDENCMRPEETFGIWLRRITKTRKMSQRHLANMAGVDHSSISRMFKEDRIPSLPVFSRIVVTLRISPETALNVMEAVTNRDIRKKNKTFFYFQKVLH